MASGAKKIADGENAPSVCFVRPDSRVSREKTNSGPRPKKYFAFAKCERGKVARKHFKAIESGPLRVFFLSSKMRRFAAFPVKIVQKVGTFPVATFFKLSSTFQNSRKQSVQTL